MLTNRQSKILDTIVEEYIKTAVPVSSGIVFDIGDFNVSCPTIRNEMAWLTDLGYLAQPHTSAGRIPTESGYRFFVDELLAERKSNKDQSCKKKKRNIKKIAKNLSVKSRDIAIFIDENGDLRYVGLQKMLSKPEFHDFDSIINLIGGLEYLEKSIDRIFENLDDELGVFIGSENPFFEQMECSMMISRLDDGFISLLGPMRMNYKRNLELFEEL